MVHILTFIISNGLNKKYFLFVLLLIPFLIQHSLIYAVPNKVENVVVNEAKDGNSAVIVIESNRSLIFKVSEVFNSPEIQVQLQEEVLSDKEPSQFIGGRLVKEVQYVYYAPLGGRKGAQLLKLISIRLAHRSAFSVSQKDWVLSITLNKIQSTQSNSVSSSKTSKFNSETLSTGIQIYGDIIGEYEPPRMVLSFQPSLKEFVQVGLANHRPLEIAQKELDLAKKKLFESRRNFLPVISGRSTQTRGKTQSDPNDPSTISEFRRQEIGVEVGQPIFQSGRLYYSARQAKAQKEIAELQVNKISQDVTFEVLKNLFIFLQTKESLSLRKTLLEESEKILETTERKKEIGVASESEYLGVLSGANQIEYKTISQEKDLEIVRSRLLSGLNLELLPDNIPISIDENTLQLFHKDFELENLISMALSSRPELKIAYLNAKFKEYGKKISRADYLFKVDASGFLGQSGAAFKDETLTLKDSYNVGVKGVLYFGGSSLSPMVSRDKTAPDLGSNSRTETEAESLSVGLLDSLTARSNYFQAKIDEEKSKEELRKTKKDIILEVKDAFFNYQKAKIQIGSARKEVEYRKKEFAIAKAKDKLHQIEAPQYLQTMASLVESEVELKQAVSFYLTSIAFLEKATSSKLTSY